MTIMTDGFPTLIDIPGAGTTFEEIEVGAPAIDRGGFIDTTTMRRTRWRTRGFKKLLTLDKISLKVAWDPIMYQNPETTLFENTNALINLTFPDGNQVGVWCFVDCFKPDPNKEGERPTAMLELIVTNQDNSGTEVAPNYI